MRRPSRWTLWLLAFVAVGFSFYLAPSLSSRPGPVDEAFSRLQVGMTWTEVYNTFGDTRPGEITLYDSDVFDHSTKTYTGFPPHGNPKGCTVVYWETDRGTYLLQFDRSGRVRIGKF